MSHTLAYGKLSPVYEKMVIAYYDSQKLFSNEMHWAEVTMIPQTWVDLTDEQDIKMMNRILDLLDEDDDVQAVYHNWNENE